MSQVVESLYKNITLTDVQLASAYYPILVDLARHKHCLTYSDLVLRAKEAYPDKQVVQSAIAVSAGRRLDVVRLFTAERDLPDLTCLVINKGSGECGIGFTRHFDPKLARDKVFAFDWGVVSTDFDWFVKEAEARVKPRKKIKEAQALSMMADYFRDHRATLPVTIREQRELIVEMLMEGFSPEEAFGQAASNVA
jgi:hypothetical protein